HFHFVVPFQYVKPRKLLSEGLTTFVLVALTFRNSFLSSHDVTDFMTRLAAISLLTKMLQSSALCRNRHSADYTEVETMPKLFIKANSLKRFQISFSA